MNLLQKHLDIKPNKSYKLEFSQDTKLFVDHGQKFCDIKSGDILFLLVSSNNEMIDIIFNWEKTSINRPLNTTYLLEWLEKENVSEVTQEEIDEVRWKISQLVLSK